MPLLALRARLTWDVDRLIALSRDLPRRRIELASIGEIDEVY